MTFIATHLATVPSWIVLLGVFALPALEASTLLGLVVPGELAVLLGGVFADQGRVPLVAVMVAAVLGAVTGDSAGYALGARFGPVLFARATGATARRLLRARGFVQRFGGYAVVLGRWTALLRALVPSAVGASGLPYRRFAVFNLVGGTVWGVTIAAIGFLTGAAYRRAEHTLGLAGAAGVAGVIVLVVVAPAVAHLLGRRRPSAEHH